MDKMKTAKILSKYFILFSTLTMLSSNLLGSTQIGDVNLEVETKFDELSEITSTSVKPRSHGREMLEVKSPTSTELFQRRKEHMRNTCSNLKQTVPNNAG